MAIRVISRGTGISRLAACLGLCCAIGLAGASAQAAAAPALAPDPAAAAPEWRYRVASGDTLISLAAAYLEDPGDWPRLQRHNRVADPRRLVPGSFLRIPCDWLRREATLAEVVFVQGRASLQRLGTQAELPLVIGSRVQAADTLRTGAQSSLSLRFADASRLLIAPDSEVTMEQLLVYGRSGIVDSRLRVRRGSADVRVTPNAERPPLFEVLTPAMNLGVRGTDFRVRFDAADAAARVEVLEGRVGIRGASAPAIPAPTAAVAADTLLVAGFGVLARAQQPIEAPRALLPAPRLVAPQQAIELLSLSLSWPEVDGAQAYRAQVYAADRSDALLRDALLTEASVRWDGAAELPDGSYRLRVRALDAAGIEGRDADIRFELRARPVAPALRWPPPGAVLGAQSVALRWEAQPEVLRYRVQVAGAAGFAPALVDREVLGNSTELELAAGSYLWRVAALAPAAAAGSAQRGPFGSVLGFELRALASLPELEPPQFSPAQLLLRWKSNAAGQGVQLQLADNPSFDRPLVDRQTWASQLQLARPPAGTYHLRLRSIIGQQTAGEFGPAREIVVPALAWWERIWLPALGAAH